jgi:hypothetical protein
MPGRTFARMIRILPSWESWSVPAMTRRSGGCCYCLKKVTKSDRHCWQCSASTNLSPRRSIRTLPSFFGHFSFQEGHAVRDGFVFSHAPINFGQSLRLLAAVIPLATTFCPDDSKSTRPSIMAVTYCYCCSSDSHFTQTDPLFFFIRFHSFLAGQFREMMCARFRYGQPAD